MDIIRNIPVRGGKTIGSSRRLRDALPVLFLVLVPLVIIVPVLPSGFSTRPVIIFFITLLLLAGIYCMRGNRRRFLLSCILALIATETFWVSLWPSASSLFLPGEFFLLLFLLYLAGYLSWELVFSEGEILDEIGIISCLVLIGGMILGTALHLSGWISRTVTYSPASIHTSYAKAIPEGILLLIRGGESSFGTAPLIQMVVMIGAVCGFLLIVLSAGKIAGIYMKKSGADGREKRE